MKWLPLCLSGILGFVLVGCSVSGEDELRQWMSEQRSQVHPKVMPLVEPKKFLPQAYTQEAAVDPFSLQKLTQALKRDSTQSVANTALIAPELARRKEALEAYPVDSMAMVGSLRKAGQPVALLRIDNLLYQVRVGNYLGLNYGRVTKIDESELTLREIVQDSTGDWVERSASLVLQEGAK
ncbi:type IV pilus assembly protein PilP [Rhodoferax ferrireducens]|uniref:Type IV pilus assembly protein PilP n=1 Tax=Rhodoferax ferrireducens TaxID=192843 RepID=A0ABU2CFL1_9BURK|nr:pilus assembly protein PilP [Rhodoferax ferrireducens]MDR7380118.1 type IV pilus assembly protein PilP [Rhodoferax ferrireducens]